MMNGLLSKTAASSLYCKARLDTCFTKMLGGSGAVLMLHRVRKNSKHGFAPNRNLSISPEFLDEVLADLAQKGFIFASMDEIAADLITEKGETDKRKIAITLDDGYLDNFVNAAPIFRKHAVPYTIYVVPGYVDGRIPHWTDAIEAIVARCDRVELPFGDKGQILASASLEEKYRTYSQLVPTFLAENGLQARSLMMRRFASTHGFDLEAHRRQLTMNWHQVREADRDHLCTIGAHSMTHRALSKLNTREALSELTECRRAIANQLGKTPRHFAYPYGEAYQREYKLAKKAGFTTAVTTVNGVIAGKHRDRLNALPRIMIDGCHQNMDVVNTQLSGIPGHVLSFARKLRQDLKLAQLLPQEILR